MTAELVVEVLELLLYGVASLGLSAGGLYVERLAIEVLQRGDLALGVWAVVLGAIVFAFGYLVATDHFRPQLQQVRAGLDASE